MACKLEVGDVVHINKELPPTISNFISDRKAVIVKYDRNKHQVGSDLEHNYGVSVKGFSNILWYNEPHLQLMKRREHSR